MSNNHKKDADQKRIQQVIKESKELCEVLRDKEFAFISKVELAVVINNLVAEMGRKDDKIKLLEEQLGEVMSEKEKKGESK
ncbi:MAG: hypothetical protein WC125_08890 [Bacteroidales bacterium]